MPDADDRLGDAYATVSADYPDAAYSSAAFVFTAHEAVPESGPSNALLIRSCSTPGVASCDRGAQVV